MSKRVAVISDTHGILRDEVCEYLKSFKSIIHAGDVGKPEVIEILNQLGELTVVRGNNDKGSWAEALPNEAIVEYGGAKIYVVHEMDKISIDPVMHGVNIVITGHSHKAAKELKDSVLYLNPGSIGPRRFKLPISMAVLEVDDDRIDVEIVEFED